MKLAVEKEVQTSSEDFTYHTLRNDMVFKAVFARDKNDLSFLEWLISEVLERDVKVVKLLSPELNIRNIKERGKRLDCLVETDDGFLNVEVNAKYDNVTKVRNFNYFTSFYSQHTQVGEEYDLTSEFVHISLNFGKNTQTPAKCKYYVYDKEHDNNYLENFIIIEVNVDYYKKVWYSKSKAEVMKYPVLVMLGMEEIEMEDMAKNSGKVKEIKEELDKLNNDPEFQFYFDQEEADRREVNTRINIATKQGIERGVEQTKIDVAKAMLKKENFADEIIIEISGITKEELENIKKDL